MNLELNPIRFEEIERLISTAIPPLGMSTKIIAIDGCGGAGKSTLAAKLATYLGNCAVVHTDDFASQDNSLGWYPRMLAQFLQPISRNQIAQFQKYDWNKKQLDNWITVEPQKFIILEGVSSSRVEFRTYLSFKIFVRTNRDMRLQRGLARDGQHALSLWKKWMQEEDEYIARDNPEALADLIVSGEMGTNQDMTVFGFSNLSRKS